MAATADAPWKRESRCIVRINGRRLACAAILAVSACRGDAPPARPAAAVPPAWVILRAGTYDIPNYLEQNTDIRFDIRRLTLDALESEYSRFQPSQLTQIGRPGRATAWRYSPRSEDIRTIKFDDVAVKAQPGVQICVAGEGCIDLYSRVDLIDIELESDEAASRYAAAVVRQLQESGGRHPAQQREGATFVGPEVAVRPADRRVYILSGFMSDSLDAVLRSLR